MAVLVLGIALSVATTNLAFGQEILTLERNGKVLYMSEDGTNPIPIISESMMPHFEVGEYAILNFTIPFEEVEEEDIIIFDCMEETGRYMMHRVTDVDEYEDGSRAVETTGDNNNGEQFDCEKKISQKEYVGKIIVEESVSYMEAFA